MLVEIWSDIVCPWCLVGKARFEQALTAFPHRDAVEIVWRAFELDPDAPTEREGDYADHLARKYGGGRAAGQAMIDRMTGTAAEAGLKFRFDRARPGNTFDGHRLLHLARERGRQDEVAERFFRGYLTEGEPIGRPEALRRLAVEAGLDPDEVDTVLAGDGYAEAVRADERRARELGVGAVPFFVLDGRYGLAGAQPAELLGRALVHVWSETRSPAGVGAHRRQGRDHVGREHVGHDPADCADGACAI